MDGKRSGFKFSTNRRLEIELKNDLKQISDNAAKQIATLRASNKLTPIEESPLFQEKMAAVRNARKSKPVFHNNLEPIVREIVIPNQAADVLASMGVMARKGTVSGRPLNVRMEGQTVVANDIQDHCPLVKVRTSSLDVYYEHHRDQRVVPAIVKEAGTTQGLLYSTRQPRKKYNVKLIKKESTDSRHKIELLEDRQLTHLLSGFNKECRKSLSESRIGQPYDYNSLHEDYSGFAEGASNKIKKRRRSSTMSAKRVRTVETIMANLKEHASIGSVSKSDRRINQIMSEVMNPLGGQDEDAQSPERMQPGEKDELRGELGQDGVDQDSCDPSQQPMYFQNEQSPESVLSMVKLAERTSPLHKLEKEQTYEQQIAEYQRVKQLWDAGTFEDVTFEDLLNVEGNQIFQPGLREKPAHFIAEWVPIESEENMSADVIETTKAHQRTTIHHFCCSSDEGLLPQPLNSVAYLSHTPSKYIKEPVVSRFEVKNADNDDESCITDDMNSDKADRIFDRVFELESIDSIQKAVEDLVMDGSLHIHGKSASVSQKVSRLIWKLHPSKIEYAPSVVKSNLFPDYVEYQHADTTKQNDALLVHYSSELEEFPKLFDDNDEIFSMTKSVKKRNKSCEDLTQYKREIIYEDFLSLTEIKAKLQLEHPSECFFPDVIHEKGLKSARSRKSLSDIRAKKESLIIQDSYSDAMAEVQEQKLHLKNYFEEKKVDKLSVLSTSDKRIKCAKSALSDEIQMVASENAIDPNVALEAGLSYVPQTSSVKKKLPKTSKVAINRMKKIEEFLTEKPNLIWRSSSMPDVREKDMKHLLPQIEMHPSLKKSWPSLIDFDDYCNQQGYEEPENERDFVRKIWNHWFDLVMSPADSSDIEVISPTDSKTTIENRTVSLFPESLKNVEDSQFLTDSDVNIEKREIMLNEIRNITETQDNLSAWQYARRGALSRKCGLFKQAYEDLTMAIAREPQYCNAYWHRHLLFLTEDDTKSALDDLNMIIKHSKSHFFAYQSMANIYEQLDDTTMAITCYSQALRIRPGDHSILSSRARVYEKEGNTTLAMEDYALATKVNPCDTGPLLKQGSHYFLTGNWTDAIQAYNDILRIDDKHAPSYLQRGKANTKCQRWMEAYTDFSTALHLDPMCWEAFYHRGCLLRESNPKDALQDFSTSLMINSSIKNIMSLFHRGLIYYAMEEYKMATADYEQIVRINPVHSPSHINLGFLHLYHFNSPVSASRKLAKAINVDPSNAASYVFRAEAFKMNKDLKSAQRDYTKAVHLDPANHVYHICRGHVLLQRGFTHLAAFSAKCASVLNKNVMLGGEAVQQATVHVFLNDYEKAIEVLKTAINYNKSPDLFMLLGKTQHKSGKIIDALISFSEALKLYEPSNVWKSWPMEAAEAHYWVGICQKDLDNCPMAFQEFSSAIKIDRHHAMAYYHRGLCHAILKTGKPILDFNRALAINPNVFEIYLSRACFYATKGLYCKGILNCNKAIELMPDSSRAYLYRGSLKYHARTYQLAVDDLTTAISIDRSCDFAYFNRAICYAKLGLIQEAVADYGTLLKMPNEFTLQVYTNRGLLYYNSGDYSNALSDLKQALSLSPNDFNLEHTIGLCLHKLRELKKSVAAFTSLSRAHPNNIECYLSRGNVFMDYGHSAAIHKAKRDYQKAIMIKPTSVHARMNLATCLQVLGKLLQSWKQFTNILQLYPNEKTALAGRAIISLQLQDLVSAYRDLFCATRSHPTAKMLSDRGVVSQFAGHVADAMSDYQRAMKLDPKYPVPYYNAANLYFFFRRFEEALKFYDKAIELSNKDEGAYLNRAITKVMLQDSAGALEDFNSALKLSPHSAHIYFNRANLYASLLKYEEAENDYTQADDITPDDMLILSRRGEVRSKLGRNTDALLDYKAVLDMEGT